MRIFTFLFCAYLVASVVDGGGDDECDEEDEIDPKCCENVPVNCPVRCPLACPPVDCDAECPPNCPSVNCDADCPSNCPSVDCDADCPSNCPSVDCDADCPSNCPSVDCDSDCPPNCPSDDCPVDCDSDCPPNCPPVDCPGPCPEPMPDEDFDPIPMTKTGRRICLPSKRQSLDINSFRMQVEGRTYSNVYAIIESVEPTTMLFGSRYRFHVSGTGEIQRDKTFRNSAGCSEVIGEDFGTFTTRGKHFFVNGERTNAAGQSIPVRIYLVSQWPEDYLIIMTCDTANIKKGRFGTGDYRVEILVSQDPPRSVNWVKIEKELRRALHVGLTDSRNYFLYTRDCTF